MKVFVVAFAVIVAAVAYVSAASYGAAPSGGYGSSSGGVSMPAPPCPNNYIFSCQPSLTPAPCAPQQSAASSYGSSGAYSEHRPRYVNAGGYPAVVPVGYQYPGVYY